MEEQIKKETTEEVKEEAIEEVIKEEQEKPKESRRKKVTFNRIYSRVFLIGFFTFFIALLIYFKPYQYNSIKIEFVIITLIISILFVVSYPILRWINKDESSILYRIFFEISDYLYLILAVIAVLEIVFIFIIFPTKVNGNSMDPTLSGTGSKKDCILVQRIVDIDRFDIIVLEVDSEINNILSSPNLKNKEMLIKRLIGMPGEEVTYVDGQLYIDGVLVEETFDKLNDSIENFTLADYSFIASKLKDGKIPKDYYFVLGDNRSNSVDSRTIGLIHKDQIVGLARFRCNNIFKIEDLRK